MNQEFLNRMKKYLNETEYLKLIESYSQSPSRSIRLNKIDSDIFKNNINMPLEKIEYDKDGYYLNNEEKYGNHPYHHLGAFYFQEPSAMAPVNMYSFNGDETVLDLCAAPGGKSSQILARIPNGVLVSNDPSNKRSKILFGNLERLGFSNIVVTNETPNRLSKKLGGFFDVILVDSPCSGEGMMRKDQTAREMWNLNNIFECANRDIEILNHADKMLKKDGILIYSTCTFAREEDEDIVTYLIDELGYEILPANPNLLSHTKDGFIKDTLRFYPFTGRGEGQFMAVLRKTTESKDTVKMKKNQRPTPEMKIVLDFIKENLTYSNFDIEKIGNRYYATSLNIDLEGLNVVTNGVELGEVSGKRFIPYHHMFKALGQYFKNIVKLDVNDSRVNHYIRGEEIDANCPNGYGVIEIDGLYLGGFKATNNKLKNHYPKGLRNMNIIEE